jgi:hypothetical protein
VHDVATAWGPHWTGKPVTSPKLMASVGPTPERYRFVTTLDAVQDPSDGTWHYTALYLTRERRDGAVDWPVMGVFTPGGPIVTMGAGVDTPRGRRYDFPAGIEAFTLVGFEMRFAGLAIAAYQNASAQVQVLRNTALSTDAPTRAGFVYQTLPLSFPDQATPLLSWTDPFPIGVWSDLVAQNPLGPVFTALFGADTKDRTISCGIRYGYALAVGDDVSIVTYLPVKYRPTFTYSDDAATGTIQQIIGAVRDWRAQAQPVSTGGRWVIGLTFYSALTGQMDRPLLELPVSSPITA